MPLSKWSLEYGEQPLLGHKILAVVQHKVITIGLEYLMLKEILKSRRDVEGDFEMSDVEGDFEMSYNGWEFKIKGDFSRVVVAWSLTMNGGMVISFFLYWWKMRQSH